MSDSLRKLEKYAWVFINKANVKGRGILKGKKRIAIMKQKALNTLTVTAHFCLRARARNH